MQSDGDGQKCIENNLKGKFRVENRGNQKVF